MKTGFLSLSLVSILALAIAGCGSGGASMNNPIQSQSKASVGMPHSSHVVIVMEENRSYSSVGRQTSVWPNLNQLIREGGLAMQYYANVHPSIGNYFYLTTGQLLTSNDSSRKIWNVDNIARRMLASGTTFRIYAESDHRKGTLAAIRDFTYSGTIRFHCFPTLPTAKQSRMRISIPFTQFATDVAKGTLPQYSFVVPNIDDYAHSAPPQQADTWLHSKVIAPLSTNSSWEPGGTGVLIVDFDESVDSDTAHGGGHVAAVFWGPNVKAGYKQTSSTIYQHQSMLRTEMELLGLSSQPAKASSAPTMTEFFK